MVNYINENHLRVKCIEFEWIKDESDKLILINIRNCKFSREQHKPITNSMYKHIKTIIAKRSSEKVRESGKTNTSLSEYNKCRLVKKPKNTNYLTFTQTTSRVFPDKEEESSPNFGSPKHIAQVCLSPKLRTS